MLLIHIIKRLFCHILLLFMIVRCASCAPRRLPTAAVPQRLAKPMMVHTADLFVGRAALKIALM